MDREHAAALHINPGSIRVSFSDSLCHCSCLSSVCPCFVQAALEEAKYYDAPAGDGGEGDNALLGIGDDMEGDADLDAQSVVEEDAEEEEDGDAEVAGAQASKERSPAAALAPPEALHPSRSIAPVGGVSGPTNPLTITAPATDAIAIASASRRSGDSSGDSSGAGSRSGGSKSQSPATSGHAGRRLQSRIQRYAEAFGAWCTLRCCGIVPVA